MALQPHVRDFERVHDRTNGFRDGGSRGVQWVERDEGEGAVRMEEDTHLGEGGTLEVGPSLDDLDMRFGYLDTNIETVLGHCQKEVQGSLYADKLGSKFGGYGSFLPTHVQGAPVLTGQHQATGLSHEDQDYQVQHHIHGPMLPELPAISEADAQGSRQRIADFLLGYTAYELLPESGKVVALDVMLPVKQAFHALYEQGIPAAPLWDSERQQFVGMLSASDFITILRQLGSNGAILAEEDFDTHTIAAWKYEKSQLSRQVDGSLVISGRHLLYTVAE